MRAIKNLDCSDSFLKCNFASEQRLVRTGTGTRRVPYYEMTRDGWSFLVMGFNGKKAAENFGKSHGNVMQAIKRLDCSDSFFEFNFQSEVRQVRTGTGTYQS